MFLRKSTISVVSHDWLTKAGRSDVQNPENNQGVFLMEVRMRVDAQSKLVHLISGVLIMFVVVQNVIFKYFIINTYLRLIFAMTFSEMNMLPQDANNPQNSENLLIVDTPKSTKKFLAVAAVILGLAALIVYFWDPEFIPSLMGSTKR